MNKYIDVIIGNRVFIANSFLSNLMMDYRVFVDNEIKNDWIIAFQMDYKLENIIVSRKHLKYKQVAKLINISVEHGIKAKRDRLIKHGFLLFYYLFERFADTEIVNMIKQLIHTKHDQTTLNDLFSIFILFLFMLSISLIVFIAENAYFRLFNYLNTKNG